ncbi:MAG: hypothetical protein A2504_11460 [Bdellovibrionales bacterium RIFOXYD12_FULL_39_22]|nr:MAG: hypothetical protein A2385_15975 [Bdellovibrionales bacterium RIFOXYB1_FULL_39_21]OFZ44544.1 MAG: hypothetical protein A2485_06920 [Bdellovibrionales bacterium RIFOXYC12_FULL_39_17]OFZ49814.1 MAG: hypothetical protein A2404_00545 [Bdellovibrionales bacterium RIFOXYC1_FULL_39_130]OFZ72086.1 MAG: hypothetical protein A2451_09215 [Bdellovibrionales bacterium RIFOXYC2_FULL_39_8]OFZ76819.1 MAG: hypothetical protein A2560_05345 [Bdellovibrionales bacterium RIFOXYD1_FULL_39_84]OFZ95746.1 MAG:
MTTFSAFLTTFFGITTAVFSSVILGVTLLVQADINHPFKNTITQDEIKYNLKTTQIYSEGLLSINLFAIAHYLPQNTPEEFQLNSFWDEHFIFFALRDITKEKLGSLLGIAHLDQFKLWATDLRAGEKIYLSFAHDKQKIALQKESFKQEIISDGHVFKISHKKTLQLIRKE